MPNSTPLLTASWNAVRQHQKAHGDDFEFVPVRTSVGTPRYFKGANDFPHVSAVAPYGVLRLEGQAFIDGFRRRLESKGVEEIQAKFDAIYEQFERPLVLLCFETVSPEGFDHSCHRRTFAEWWEEKTGQVVPETDALDHESLQRLLAAT